VRKKYDFENHIKEDERSGLCGTCRKTYRVRLENLKERERLEHLGPNVRLISKLTFNKYY
jgi:hypothetical protein